MKALLFISILALTACSNHPDKDTVVGIVPYDGMDKHKISEAKKAIETYYNVSIKILEDTALPKSAFINIKSPRYRADSLIHIQKRTMPKGIDYILGLTEKDISATKHGTDGKIKSPEWKYTDFGIMGLAYCPGNSAIVSDYRIKHKDKAVQFGRFKKVIIHELGHNFGLPHCPDKKCVMTDAVESVKTIDNANPGLCKACKAKLDM
jgi:archaemetzincin